MWDALEETEWWPEWWRGVERVTELEPQQRHLIAWRSRIPYELEFEFEFDVQERDPPCSMFGHARRARTVANDRSP